MRRQPAEAETTRLGLDQSSCQWDSEAVREVIDGSVRGSGVVGWIGEAGTLVGNGDGYRVRGDGMVDADLTRAVGQRVVEQNVHRLAEHHPVSSNDWEIGRIGNGQRSARDGERTVPALL